MVQNIIISKKEMELINDLLNLDGDEIYQKYGFKLKSLKIWVAFLVKKYV